MKNLAMALILAVSSAALPALAQPARGEAVVFTGGNFSGPSIVLRNDTANFEPLGFNDRAASLRVIHGTWELCDDSFYRGSCRVYSPGEYRDLGGQSQRVSSARLVVSGAPGWGPGGGPGGHPAPGGGWEGVGGGDVAVFEGRDFRGYLANLTAPTRNFEVLGFNDRVSSMVVRRGLWEFCTDSEFGGGCQIYGPGEYSSLPGASNAYSSARPIQPTRGDRNPNRRRGRASIVLFDGADFSGRSLSLDNSADNLNDIGFNDRVDSVIVEGGRWRLCSDAGGRGSCQDYGPGRYRVLPPQLRGRLSSVYVR
ncbi:MAG: beta/gamma crystallin-related protein [Usitatibacter sp.]